MSSCPACGVTNPAGFRFCGECGSALVVASCAACGHPNPTGQRFCGSCGVALGESPPPSPAAAPPEERKLATVLFADVVGFTSMAEATDHEVVARTVDAAFRRLADVVSAHGGTIDKYMGDSLMAVFGVPQAHDDDAERAVAAGLAMRDVGGDLAFSIGINSGEVMVAGLGHAGTRTVIGDTVNVAARLEKVAGPGEVLVGELTARLANRKLVFRPRSPVVLKGKRDPVPVWEAVARRPVGREGSTVPLIGRDDELTFLRSQWRRVRVDDRAAVVLVTGDAGVGKTRLLEALAVEAADDGGRVVRAAYPGYGGPGGARVAADIVSQLGRLGDPDVDARVRSIAGELHPSLQVTDAAAMRQEQLWAFQRLVRAKAAEQPLVVLVDDFHRSGPTITDLLGELMVRVAGVPVLLVLAGRPEPADWLARFPAATTLRLGPLGRVEAVALAGAFAGDESPDDTTVERLVERAGGNPLYLRELVALFADQPAATAVPATLQAVLAARLDALEPVQKACLQHVAVLADAATAAHVAALGVTDPAPALRALVDCGLLRPHGQDGYDIVDPLLREVAYEALPRHIRGSRHREAAELCSGEQRAVHLDRAAGYLPDDEGLRAEAAAALADAGMALLDGFRDVEGSRLLRRAIELGERRPQVLLRLAKTLSGSTPDHDEALRILDLIPPDADDPTVDPSRRHIRAATRMFSEPASALPELLDVADTWGTLGETNRQAWALANAGIAAFTDGRVEESGDLLERAVEQFEADGDRHSLLAVRSAMSLVRPDHPRMADWLAEAVAHSVAIGDRGGEISALISLGWYRYFEVRLGGPADVADAETVAVRLIEIGDDLADAGVSIYGLSVAASLARLSGQLDRAAELAATAEALPALPARADVIGAVVEALRFSAALALDADADLPVPVRLATPDPLAAFAAIIVGESLVLAGRFEEGWTAYGGAGEHLTMGSTETLVRFPQYLGMVLAGRGAEARDPLAELIAAADRRQAHPVGAAARALAAEAAFVAGDHATAELLLAEITSVGDGGLAAALVARGQAVVVGDADARTRLNALAADLGAPALLFGLGGN